MNVTRMGISFSLLLYLTTIFQTFGQTTAACPSGRFGDSCQYACHCRSEIQCTANGDCPGESPCAPGWMGQKCQYVNIAYGSNATQSTTYGVYGAGKAIDGKTTNSFSTGSSCTHTIWEATPSWQTDLGRPFWIQRLKLHNRDMLQERLGHFKVYVGNSTAYHDNILCYSEPNKNPGNVINIVCGEEIHGRYVTVLVTSDPEDRVLTICEVEIYNGQNVALGRPTGQSSDRSGTVQSGGQQTEFLYKSSLAVDGSTFSYLNGQSCSSTVQVYEPWWKVELQRIYKIKWMKIFNEMGNPRSLRNLVVTVYNHTNVGENLGIHAYRETKEDPGSVIIATLNEPVYGDLVVLWLQKVNEFLTLCEVEIFAECIDGEFGVGCESVCHCKMSEEVCDKMTGHCVSGCSAGYLGFSCQETCLAGKYGEDCQNSCSKNCIGQTCSNVNGTCTLGCVTGFTGDTCESACPAGSYGAKCAKLCVGCRGGSCHHVSGLCQTACLPGYVGAFCDQVCNPGTFGEGCLQQCSSGCINNMCNHITGECSGDGCVIGYEGLFCDQQCVSGTYGKKCGETCSQHCRDGSCDKVNGSCIYGCEIGWTTPQCSSACRDGMYGVNCSIGCSINCVEWLCHHIDGSCKKGCSSGWQGSLCLQAVEESDSMGTIAGALGGVLVVLVIVLVIVIVIVIRRIRKRNPKQRNTNSGQTQENMTGIFENDLYVSHDDVTASNGGALPLVSPTYSNQLSRESSNDSQQQLTKTNENKKQTAEPDFKLNGLYYNLMDFNSENGIKIDRLAEYVNVRKHESNPFEEEYKELPQGLSALVDSARKPENIRKNRYRNIYAYDHSRVILSCEDETDSDYINACYIDGYKSPKAYIAAQGPTEVILNDYWRMIWQCNISHIVMLTNLYEDGKPKCVQYWPENKSEEKQYREIKVTFVEQDVYADFVTRHLRAEKGGVKKQVKQYHFTAWPDKDVPNYASSLIHFRNRVKVSSVESGGPTLVHCSAGIGRTGTYIALDYLMNEAESEGSVDINGCVKNMRKQRTQMVQTLGQYIFVHEALIEATDFKDTTKTIPQFRDYISNSSHKDMEAEYQRLRETTGMLADTCFSSGRELVNKPKNRYSNILPAEEHRPLLYTPADGCNDYINAVFLQGLKKRFQFIATQLPLPNTKVDFWRLIYEQDVKCIVVLADLSNKTSDDEMFWPTDKKVSKEYSPLIVSLSETAEVSTFVHFNMKCKLRGQNDDCKEIQLYQFKEWPKESSVPSHALRFVEFIEETDRLSMSSSQHPIVVVCMDGAERCGLYCTLYSTIERLKVDQVVTICDIIKQHRRVRQQIIPNMTQFSFCHEAVISFLDANETYSNFT